MAKSSQPAQAIEELKSRFDDLNTQKVRLQTQKERAEEDLAELKQQAHEQFGTDNLKKLEAKLAEMKKQNEKQKSEYQKQLDAIDKKLLQIDEMVEEEAV